MPHSKLRRFLAPIAAAVVLASAGTAEAGNYMGSFDPVDMNGSYHIFIPNECLSFSGWIPNDGTVCALGSFTDATANVVSTSPDPTYTGSLFFQPGDGVAALLGFFIQNGEFLAPDTTLIPFTPPGAPETTDSWFIQFTSGQCGPGSNQFMPECGGNNLISAGSALYTSTPACQDSEPCVPPPCEICVNLFGPQQALPPGNVFIYVNPSAAPEPGTLALLAGALGAGWFARRRKRSVD